MTKLYVASNQMITPPLPPFSTCSIEQHEKHIARVTLYLSALFFMILTCLVPASSQVSDLMFDGHILDLSADNPFSNPTSLPIQVLGGESLVYLGQMPSLHQKALFSEAGDLRIFIQDGIIYNNTGHAIAAPSNIFINGQDQLTQDISPGGSTFTEYTSHNNGPDVQIVRVPLTDHLYYVVFTERTDQNLDEIGLYAVIVDLDRDNPHFDDPMIKGTLIDPTIQAEYRQFDDLQFDSEYPSRIHLHTFDVSADLNKFAFMELLTMGDNPGSKLFVSSAEDFLVFNLVNSGVFVAFSGDLDYCDTAIQRTQSNTQNQQNLLTQSGGQMRAVYSPQLQSYLVAFSTGKDFNASSPLSSQPQEKVILVRLNCHATSVIQVTCINGPDGNVYGLEFSPDGEYLYVNSNGSSDFSNNFFVIYDLTSGSHIDDSTVSTFLMAHPEYRTSRLYRASGDDFENIYLQGENGNIAVIQNISDLALLTISPVLVNPTLENTSFNAVLSDAYPDLGLDAVAFNFFSTAFNDAEHLINEELTEECCLHLSTFEGFRGKIPYTEVSLEQHDSVYYNINHPNWVFGDLHLYPGADLIYKNLTFHFGSQSIVNIDKNARLKLDSTTFSSMECIDMMWQGIRIHGTADAPQELYFNPNQGWLGLSEYSSIEDAWAGVIVESGGIVQSVNSTFRNNANGVRFDPYPAAPLQIGNNISGFRNTTFITDGLLNVSYIPPSSHVSLQGMNKVNFGYCSFLNTAPFELLSINKRGIGINSINSTFQVFGDNQPFSQESDEVHDAFYRLTTGIRAVNNTMGTFSAYKMEFQECRSGIQAAGMQGEVIAYNNFTVPPFTIALNESNRFPEAVYLLGSTGYSVEENTIVGPGTQNSFGIIIDSSGDEENEIYRNAISHIRAGMYNKKINGSLAADVQTGLQVRCHFFENNNADMYLNEQSWWRLRQGDFYSNPSGYKFLTNNSFSSNLCADLADVLVNNSYGNFPPNNNPNASFDYLHQNFDVTMPDCESEHMLLLGFPGPGADFDYENSCPVNFTVQEIEVDPFTEAAGIIPVLVFLGENDQDETELLAERALVTQWLSDARETYALTVDAGEKADLLAAIQESMSVSSEQLKMLLFAASPLSEEVLKESIMRSPAMNPWHLSQVMIANSPLRKEVINTLQGAEVLSPFFMDFVMNAQENASASFKLLLEYEMSSYEKSLAEMDRILLEREQHAGWWEAGHTGPDMGAVLEKLALKKGDASREYLMSEALRTGNTQAAAAMYELVSDDSPRKDWLAYLIANPEVLSNPSEAHKEDLMQRYLADGNDYDRAFIALAAVGELQEEWPEITPPEKSLSHSLGFGQGRSGEEAIVLSVSPNPASDHIYIGYPAEADGIAMIVIHDIMGRQMHSSPLNALGVMELELKDWPEGIYIITLSHEGRTLQSKTFSIE